jgi:hypothetical protein
MYGCLGLILGVICTLITALGTPFLKGAYLPFRGAFVGYFSIIICPIVYGIVRGIGAMIARSVTSKQSTPHLNRLSRQA